MNYQLAESTLKQIRSSSLKDLVQQLISAALRYARIRSDWHLMTVEERRSADPGRTAAHNTFIDACNTLSRNMVKHSESAEWRRALGDDRKAIGDFACYLHCIVGIEAR